MHQANTACADDPDTQHSVVGEFHGTAIGATHTRRGAVERKPAYDSAAKDKQCGELHRALQGVHELDRLEHTEVYCTFT